MADAGKKRCCRCNDVLPLTAFYLNARSGKRSSWCRECRSEYDRERRTPADPAETERKRHAAKLKLRETMTMRIPCRIGRVLDEICTTHEKSLSELADLAFADGGMLCKVRSGDRHPSRSYLNDLTAAWTFITDDERRRLYESAGYLPEWREAAA